MMRFRAHKVLGTVLLVGIGTVPVVGFSAPASAAGPKIKCTSFSSSSNLSSFQLEGCTGNTGGRTIPEGGNFTTSVSLLLAWFNGQSTVVNWSSITTGGTACRTGHTQYNFHGMVSGDTTGSAPVGGAAKGVACVVPSSGKLTVAPGSAFIFK
jgi:hypothetical protein